MMGHPSTRLAWREPRWSYNPRWQRLARKLLFNRFWIVCDLACAVVIAIVVILDRELHANLAAMPIPWRVFSAAFFFHGLFALLVAIYFCFPPRLTVSGTFVEQVWAGSIRRFGAPDILSIRIRTLPSGRSVICLLTRNRRGRRIKRVRGLPTHLDTAFLNTCIQSLSMSDPSPPRTAGSRALA